MQSSFWPTPRRWLEGSSQADPQTTTTFPRRERLSLAYLTTVGGTADKVFRVRAPNSSWATSGCVDSTMM